MDDGSGQGMKAVTLLFTDLVGSTALMHRLGDEDAEEFRHTHFGLLRHALAAAGGREVKNLGDGLMAAFSAPADALSCAIAIQQAAAGHNQAHPQRSLQLRIGVHTGAVVEDGDDYFGRGVVVASRLCSAAAGGEILTSDTVRQLVAGQFRFSPLARLQLKGVPEPVATVAVAWREGEVAPPAAWRPSIVVPRNAFVGREADMTAAVKHLEAARLVTLTGPGGIGKSRLALHIAAQVADRYTDGVYVCELASLEDSDVVDLAVASALRVEETAERRARERLVEFLHEKRALLLMDNCEHVRNQVVGLVQTILRHTADVDVLATSRERLGIEGEHRLTVGSLPIPTEDDPSSPAVVLFADRMAAIRPDLSVADDLGAVCELCRRLDGMPLAIELAASQCVARSPAELLNELSGRLKTLTDERRAEQRHRSLESVVGWSYDQLGASEQEVFQRIAVFAGGLTATAASAVVGDAGEDTARSLTILVEQSLLTAEQRRGQTRFGVLEPIRQYAEARLRQRGLIEATRARHAAWATEWVELADAGLRGADEAWWTTCLEVELPNLRAAHSWSRIHSPEQAVRIVAALIWYVYGGGPSEIFTWADQTIAGASDTPHQKMPTVFATAALGAWRRGDLAAARDLVERGLDLRADGHGAAYVWHIAGNVELFRGDLTSAIAAYDQAIAIASRAGDHAAVVSAAGTRAMCVAFAGDAEQARADLAAVRHLITSAGGHAWCDYVAGEIDREVDPRRALSEFARSVDYARQAGNRFVGAVASLGALSCAVRLGEPVDLGEYEDLIDHWQRTGAWSQQWITLRTLIEALARVEDDTSAALLYGGLRASTTASPIIGRDTERLTDTVANLQRRLGQDRFNSLTAEGSSLGDDRVVNYALDIVRAHATAN